MLARVNCSYWVDLISMIVQLCSLCAERNRECVEMESFSLDQSEVIERKMVKKRAINYVTYVSSDDNLHSIFQWEKKIRSIRLGWLFRERFNRTSMNEWWLLNLLAELFERKSRAWYKVKMSLIGPGEFRLGEQVSVLHLAVIDNVLWISSTWLMVGTDTACILWGWIYCRS